MSKKKEAARGRAVPNKSKLPEKGDFSVEVEYTEDEVADIVSLEAKAEQIDPSAGGSPWR